MPNDGQTELCNDSHRSLSVPNTTSKCADFLTHLCDRQSGCDVIFSSSVWQINTKCLNLLTTFHNKRRHSFETKEKAAPINIATIDQKVKHYKLKNPQNQVTNFYEDARLFTDSKPVTSVIALLPVWWAYVNIQRISAEAALCLRLQVIWIRHSPECTWPRPCERQPFGNFGKRNFRQLSAICRRKLSKLNWSDSDLRMKRSTGTSDSQLLESKCLQLELNFSFPSITQGFEAWVFLSH